jgi:hypothetical protein
LPPRLEQPEAIARVAQGYARPGDGKLDHAIECFQQAADPRPRRKFFAHWTWRMTAQLGLCDAWLGKGDLDQATAASRMLLADVLATSHPWLRALARDASARVAMARRDWNAAQADLHDALSLVGRCSVPFVEAAPVLKVTTDSPEAA